MLIYYVVGYGNKSCSKYISHSFLDFLREDTPAGTSFLRAAAHDDDQGVNAAITYSVLHQQPEYFQINPSTGCVYVNHLISQVMFMSSSGTQSDILHLGQVTESLLFYANWCLDFLELQLQIFIVDLSNRPVHCSNRWRQQKQHGGVDCNYH